MKPLLIDLDGVLRIGKQPAPGAGEFLEFLQSNSIPSCIISNSTLSDAANVKKFFIQNGIECKIPVMTSVDASYQFLKGRYNSVEIFCSQELKHIFSEFISSEKPEAVLVGDLGKNWNFATINEIFKHVMNGADLITMQKNKYWSTPEEGLLIDAGAFVTGIEYATGKQSTLIGKPSPIYFKMGLKLACGATDVPFVMLGDDLESDIAGASNLGCESILIFTGKTNKERLDSSDIKPTFTAVNLSEVQKIFEQNFLN